MTTLPLRERRRQQAVKDLARLEAQRDTALDKLARIAAKLKAVRRSVERYDRTPVPTAVTPTAPATVEPPAPPPASPTAAPAPASGSLDLEVPDFLKRGGSIADKTPADLAAMAAIEAEQASRRTAKSRARIAKLKADKAGERRRMPLEGRAALDKIRA